MTEFLFLIYRWFLAPLVEAILRLGALVGGTKWREFLRDKNDRQFHFGHGWSSESLIKARPLWIHAASGEVEYARSIVREWTQRQPTIPVVVTYTSPSAKRILPQVPGIAAWGPAPWERRRAIREFLDRFRPRAVLFARTDVWPLLADEVRRARIPGLLFSATFAENSSRLTFGAKRLTRRTLDCLDAVHVVSSADREALMKIGVRVPIEVSGDTRYDQALHRVEHPRELPLRWDGQGPVFVAGSTWPEDEAVLFEAVKSVPRWRLILVPHETHRSGELREACRRHFEEPSILSELREPWTSRVLIVDQVGLLAELYSIGTIAFVGGSFRRKVHSVMEPLAAGKLTLVGPFHRNNREAILFQSILHHETSLVQLIRDADGLREILTTYETRTPPPSTEVRELVRKQSGATEKILFEITKGDLIS